MQQTWAVHAHTYLCTLNISHHTPSTASLAFQLNWKESSAHGSDASEHGRFARARAQGAAREDAGDEQDQAADEQLEHAEVACAQQQHDQHIHRRDQHARPQRHGAVGEQVDRGRAADHLGQIGRRDGHLQHEPEAQVDPLRAAGPPLPAQHGDACTARLLTAAARPAASKFT